MLEYAYNVDDIMKKNKIAETENWLKLIKTKHNWSVYMNNIAKEKKQNLIDEDNEIKRIISTIDIL